MSATESYNHLKGNKHAERDSEKIKQQRILVKVYNKILHNSVN